MNGDEAIVEVVEVTQADKDRASELFRDQRTKLSVKFTLGADPEPLLDALARHRVAAIAETLKLVEQHLSACQYDPAPYTCLKTRLRALQGGRG